jgi:signal transduction histidine kinase
MNDKLNILLVDDEVRNLDTLEAILDDQGYQLLRAMDADSALKVLLENDVAAIVMDVKMPGVSGFELAKMIKGTKRFRQIPILFLTAYLVDEADMAAGYGAGAVDYLTKPLNPAILRHKIGVFAELFRKTRALAELNETLEQRVLERTNELQQSEAALREANAQKDRFLATLAHELRNPLAPLRTGVALISKHAKLPHDMERPLAAMNRQIDHMVRLIDDLLDVSRISRGKLELRKEKCELMGVIERAIETTAPMLQNNGQHVAVESSEAMVSAFVDPTRIAQIVANLLNNAAKHSPRGAEIRVRLRTSAGHALIDVIDEGTGIPVDHLERIFEMFTKVERANRTNDGLGIGLALSRQLATLHGGTLSAASDGEGRGSRFTLSIPLGAVPAQVSSPPKNDVSRGRALSVVIVEDNADGAEMMTAWLGIEGHHVKVAPTGLDGVKLIEETKPDVVLCDIGLPDIDGVEVCRRVLAEMPEPPVMVALTGWGAEADRDRTHAVGFAHHVVKPVDLDKLRDLLATIPVELAEREASRVIH